MQQRILLIIGGVILAAIIVAALFYQNLALFGAKKPSAAKVSPAAGAQTANGTQKPYAIEVVPPEKIPPYRGSSVGVIHESEESKKTTSASVREKLTKQLAGIAASLAENPDDFETWIEVGSIKHAFGDETGARDAWEYASIIRPQNTISFFNLGNLFGYYLKDAARAERNFQAVVRNDPSYVAGYLALVSFYRDVAQEKYPQEAEKVLLAGEKALPLDLNILKSLALLYKNTGNAQKAIAYFEKYLAIDPQNGAIRAEWDALRQ